MEQPLSTTAASARWHPGLTITLQAGFFALFGLMIGGTGVMWAHIVSTLGLSAGVFGTAVLVAPLPSIIVLIQGSALNAWAGTKRVALAGLVFLCVAMLAFANASGLWTFVLALLLQGTGNGLLEISANTAILDWEQARKRSVMNLMHACFSGAAVVGAFGAGVLLANGWTYVDVFQLLATLCVFCFCATLPVRYPPASVAQHPTEHHNTLRLLRDRPALLTLALIGLLGVVGESIANNWSVIYLRSLNASDFVGGVTFALFNGAMLFGRLLNTPVVARYGARLSLQVSGVLLAIAGALLLVPASLPLAIAALLISGLAVAGVVPTTLSAGARLVPGNSAAVAGAIMAVTYAGFIVTPPLIGWVAELVSLQVALLVLGLSGFGILWLVRRSHINV